MTTMIQRNFSGGELTPSLYSKCDLVKYQTGVRTMRNFFIMRHGGATSRPGTGFVSEVKDSTQVVRLIPFVFNDAQTYVLEFGNLYMRVIKQGQQVREAPVSISGITNASPGVITATAHGYSNGDEVYLSGIVGPIGTYLNGRSFKVAGVTANTFTLTYMYGGAVDTTAMGSYTSSGTAARAYTIATPYAAADLATLNFTQSADVVTIAHPNYAPMELKRTGDAAWTITNMIVLPSISPPTNCGVTSSPAGSNYYQYKITAVDFATGEESFGGFPGGSGGPITAITNASPAVITASFAPTNNLDEVYLDGIGGMTDLNKKLFQVRNRTATTFELYDFYGNPVDTTLLPAFTSGGAWRLTYCDYNGAVTGSGATATLNWTTVSSASSYNIYKAVNGVFGFMGSATKPPFIDLGQTPNTTVTPPIYKNPFAKSGSYPSTVSYVQQRLSFGNTTSQPETVFMSRTGKYKNFSTSFNTQASDSITFSLVGRQVNAVRHILELSTPVIFTTGAEWALRGDASGVVTPTSINARQHSYNGCSTLRPLIIGNTALFVQARGNIVRDLAYSFQSDGYTGNDLTIFSAHLFDGYSINDWSYQQIPHSIVWAVRSDGTLLALTYIKEQQLWGWSRHDFGGTVESVCCVPEGSEDAVYLVIKRTVNGNTVRYIERMKQRRIGLIQDFVGMDAVKTIDGRNTGAATMTLSGSGWTSTDLLTLTASTSTFSASDVGNHFNLTGSDGTQIRFNVTVYTSGTVVQGYPQKNVPAAMQGIGTTTWARAIQTVTGLWHIEGKTVSVLGDGFVVASPNNAAYVPITVTNGQVTLDKPYGVIQIGLPFICDLETLDIDTPNGESMIDNKKNISRINIQVENSRGIFAGPKPPSNDAVDPLEGLYEFKERNTERYDSPMSLVTDSIEINIQSYFSNGGRVFIRQVDPVPLTILSIAASGLIPVRGAGG